jgi:hypothetical protein
MWRRASALLGLASVATGCASSGDTKANLDGQAASNAQSSDGAASDNGDTSDGAAADAPDTSQSPQLQGPTVGDFVGVNAFLDDPVSVLSAFGTVREYHSWGWNEGNFDPAYPGYPNNQLSFSLFGGSWDWDTFYAGLKTAGTMSFPCVQGGVPFVNKSAVPPVSAGADATRAASYQAHADFMFQLAARYGTASIADAKLKLAPGQTRKSGLGLLGYYEDWNEPDAYWIKPDGSPIILANEYAAMASADIDGDQGRMGPTFGIKSADPNAKLVMAGLSGKGIDTWTSSILAYIDGVRAWSDTNRAGSLPFDVINVHHYSFSTNGAGPAWSPEADHLIDKMAPVVQWRKDHLPQGEAWITEFGYDTAQASKLRAPALGPNSAEVVQGQWIVRTYLALLAAGLDRATLYILRDDCTPKLPTDCATQFQTAGVTSQKGSWAPKPAYYFIATFRQRLASMRFAGEAASGDPAVRVYRFKEPSGRGAFVVWAPTSEAKTTAGYRLAVPARATSATLVTLVDKQMNGLEGAAMISGGMVTLDVSETPALVLVDHVD